MTHTTVKDKPWTLLKMNGLEGAYRVHDDKVEVRYEGRHKTVDADHFVKPLADAAAEGLARLALAELIAGVDDRVANEDHGLADEAPLEDPTADALKRAD